MTGRYMTYQLDLYDAVVSVPVFVYGWGRGYITAAWFDAVRMYDCAVVESLIPECQRIRPYDGWPEARQYENVSGRIL